MWSHKFYFKSLGTFMSQETSSKPDSTHQPYPEADSSSQQIGKVAEGVAAYSYTPLKKPIPPQHFIAGILASNEVWRFALTNELILHLETAVRILRQSFQKIGVMQFSYEIDPEIENESWITIRANVEGTLEELLREDWAYTQAIVRAIPITKLSFIRFIPSVD